VKIGTTRFQKNRIACVILRTSAVRLIFERHNISSRLGLLATVWRIHENEYGCITEQKSRESMDLKGLRLFERGYERPHPNKDFRLKTE
jgi:hypothetical protein